MIPLDYIDLKMTDNMEADSVFELIKKRMELVNDGDCKRFRIIMTSKAQKIVLKNAMTQIKAQY